MGDQQGCVRVVILPLRHKSLPRAMTADHFPPQRPAVLLPTDATRAFIEPLTEVCYTPPVRFGKHEAWIRLRESRKGLRRENISAKTSET